MWQELADAAPELSTGLLRTLAATAMGAVGAFVVSFVFGLMALSPSIWVRGVSRTIVEFFRGTSLVVQLFWIAFALPQFFPDLKLSGMVGAVVALTLNFGAYGSEIVRGAINAVPPAQWEATVALSLSPIQRMRRVILPQAFPEMLPPFCNLLIQLLKSSSLLYLVAVYELTFEIKALRDDLGNFTAFAFGLVVYFVIAQILIALMRWWERRAAARVGRGPVFENRAVLDASVSVPPTGGAA